MLLSPALVLAHSPFPHCRSSRTRQTYSEFISFPIYVWTPSNDSTQVPDEAATAAATADWEARKAAAEASGEAFAEPAPAAATKTEWVTTHSWKVQNDNKPIWVRSPRDVDAAAYSEFYKTTFREFMDPAAHTHFSIEGDIEFKAILFLPSMAPFDQQDWMRKSRSIKLYVRRVFISDQFDEDLMPRYLNFVKGVVDSNDLPLNVSREILQESKVVRVMRKRLLRKTLDMIKELAGREDKTAYGTFWDAFGRNIKLGIIEDTGSREELASLLRFPSSASANGLTSLGEYVERMKPDQKGIYYLAADSRAAAAKAPFVAGLVSRGLEVLYLVDSIDEVAITNLGSFGGKTLVDVTKEDLDLGDGEEDKSRAEEAAREFAGLAAWLKETLDGKVESVVVSRRIAGTPCVLVTSKFGWSANMEKIMRAQTLGDPRAMEYMKGKKIMELNPNDPIILDLKAQARRGGAAGAGWRWQEAAARRRGGSEEVWPNSPFFLRRLVPSGGRPHRRRGGRRHRGAAVRDGAADERVQRGEPHRLCGARVQHDGRDSRPAAAAAARGGRRAGEQVRDAGRGGVKGVGFTTWGQGGLAGWGVAGGGRADLSEL